MSQSSAVLRLELCVFAGPLVKGQVKGGRLRECGLHHSEVRHKDECQSCGDYAPEAAPGPGAGASAQASEPAKKCGCGCNSGACK